MGAQNYGTFAGRKDLVQDIIPFKFVSVFVLKTGRDGKMVDNGLAERIITTLFFNGMIYEVNGDLRSSMLIDGTAEARLADILTIMDKRTFPKRESEKIVGGPGRLRVLVNTQRVRVEYKSNGRSYYNASDVLSFAKVRKGKNNEKKNHYKRATA